jgi:hypothetical protein
VKPEHYQKLADAKLTVEQIGVVMQIMAEAEDAIKAAEEARKSVARDRVQRWREKKKADVTLPKHNGNATVRLTRGEDNLQTTEITGKEENKKEAAPKALSDLAAFKADLEADASQEQVEAFAKHRKAKNGQNSAYSAKLFRRDAAACGLSVSQAIDTAISRGWLTVKPEYLAGRQQAPPRSTAPPKQTVGQQARDELKRMETLNDAPDNLPRYHDESDREPGFASAGIARRFTIAASR